ncbi:MAG: NAD(P)/FAD-dependent oxidoreductase [Bacteroidetes bacterium]|nr:NAD(P)/FAD-dependent oxidoreductase [Bacteroidota bacterium]
MKETNTIIIGASFSGLACAACLQKDNIDYLLIEKQNQVATPWRNHYERLHLHTSKRISNLPFKKFGNKIPRYPARQQVVDYLEDYQKEFDIHPVFNTKAISIKRENDHWITITNNEVFKSKYLVMATGIFNKPKPIFFKGQETFPGKILHSCEYKTAKDFKGQKVLVVGFGNSACEIAIDLFEHQAMPSMSVRSAVNIIPRDILGIPVLEFSLVLNRIPPRIADTVSSPLIWLTIGDIKKLGLKKMPYGPLEQIRKDGHAPVLNIGTVELIRAGHIKIRDDIDFIEGRTVHFKNGSKDDFDAIVACIGYDRSLGEIVETDQSRFDDLNAPTYKQKLFGKDGLYFCGYWVSPTGQIREIARDAKKIASDIGKKESE